MPQQVIPANTVVVACSGAGGTGDTWTNVFAVRYPVGDYPDEELLNTAFRNFYYELGYDAILPNGHTLANIKQTRNTTGGVEAKDWAYNITPPGSTNYPVPPQVAAVISWKTGLAGRSFRGRTYVGPLAVGMLSAGAQMNEGRRLSIETKAGTLRNDIITAGGFLAVWSRTLNLTTDVTSQSVKPYFDTQRRRRSSLKG